jgi:hypothetical protein
MFNAKILESNTILYRLKFSVFGESLAFKHIQEQIMEKGKTKCEFYLLRYKELEMFEDNLQSISNAKKDFYQKQKQNTPSKYLFHNVVSQLLKDSESLKHRMGHSAATLSQQQIPIYSQQNGNISP